MHLSHKTIWASLTQNNMGWLRLVGFLKLQISFAKEPYQRDYILLQCISHTKQYGVAMNSRLLKVVDLFCKRALSKRLHSASMHLSHNECISHTMNPYIFSRRNIFKCKDHMMFTWFIIHMNLYLFDSHINFGMIVLPATHCNTLQHTATHCNTLQHTATHCNTLQLMMFTWITYQSWYNCLANW